MIQIASDRMLQRRYGPVGAPAQLMHGQSGEETLDLIDPGGTGRGEVAVISGMTKEPVLHLFGLVRAVVVHDQMHVQVVGHVAVYLPEKADELFASMPAFDPADHPAGCHVQGGEQIRRAVSLIVMGPRFGQAEIHGQGWPGAVQGLDLTLLVHAQDQGLFGWVHVEPRDVLHLLDEAGVRRELEGPGQVRLQAEGFPDPMDEMVRQGHLLCQTARAPVGLVFRLAVKRRLHHGPDPFVVMLARLAGAGRVAEPFGSHAGETASPLGDRLPAHLMAFGHVLALQTPGAIQNDAGATVERGFGVASPAPVFEGLLLVFVQYDRGRYAAHLMLLRSRYDFQVIDDEHKITASTGYVK